MNKFLLFIGLIGFLACNAPDTKIDGANYYFDTKVFAEKQIEKLFSKDVSFDKTIQLRDQKEKITQIEGNKENLEREFLILKEANINKPSFLGKYTADTLYLTHPITETQTELLVYETDDSKMTTKSVEFSKGDFLKIRIANSNFMSSYEKEVYYKVGEYIEMKGWQKSLFEDTLFSSSLVEFTFE